MASCDSFDISIDFNALEERIFTYSSDDDLTFELIQLNRWLRFIGCPMSLIYRVSRGFALQYEAFVENVRQDTYQYGVRKFLFGELRGIVSSFDFKQLEKALLDNQFAIILQRMLVLREFRIAKIPREMCAQWFSAWTDRGFNYDISKFTSWNYEVDSIQFDATAFVISAPVFS